MNEQANNPASLAPNPDNHEPRVRKMDEDDAQIASMSTSRQIYCCGCGDKVDARITDGAEIYPHRKDLASLPFWKCDACGNYVGCHHKTKNRINPLGNIPTKEIRSARQHIHIILDPMWKQKCIKRSILYARLSERIGYQYHTAEIRTLNEAQKIYTIVKQIEKEIAV